MAVAAQEGDGWRSTQWGSPRTHQLWLVDISPVNDLKQHWNGDECWCHPKLTRYPNKVVMVTHNSQDLREKPDAPRFFS